MNTYRTLKLTLIAAALVGGTTAHRAVAVPMAFQQGTAQLSQGGFSPDNAVDGNFTVSSSGWAQGGGGFNNTAVWETVADTPSGPYEAITRFNFSLFSGGYGNHTVGNFRISVTTDNRALFADDNDNFGFSSPGVGTELGVTWTPLIPDSVTGTNLLTTFTVDGTGKVLVGGTLQDPDTYTVTGNVALIGITGVRLEMLTDGSLPFNGPGRAVNGNFVLIEFQGDSVSLPVPEPSTIALLGFGIVGLVVRRRRRVTA